MLIGKERSGVADSRSRGPCSIGGQNKNQTMNLLKRQYFHDCLNEEVL